VRPEDVRVGMEFWMLDICSYYGKVEAVDGEYALVSYHTCFSGGRDKILLTELVNEKVYGLRMPEGK